MEKKLDTQPGLFEDPDNDILVFLFLPCYCMLSLIIAFFLMPGFGYLAEINGLMMPTYWQSVGLTMLIFIIQRMIKNFKPCERKDQNGA